MRLFFGQLFVMEHDRVRRAPFKRRHNHLRVVELVGFIGHKSDLFHVLNFPIDFKQWTNGSMEKLDERLNRNPSEFGD